MYLTKTFPSPQAQMDTSANFSARVTSSFLVENLHSSLRCMVHERGIASSPVIGCAHVNAVGRWRPLAGGEGGVDMGEAMNGVFGRVNECGLFRGVLISERWRGEEEELRVEDIGWEWQKQPCDTITQKCYVRCESIWILLAWWGTWMSIRDPRKDWVYLEEPNRLPSSIRINLSVCPSVRPSVHPSVRLSVCTYLQIRYSVENGTGPIDLVNYSSKSWINDVNCESEILRKKYTCARVTQ